MVWNKWNHKKYYKYCKDNNLNLPVQKYVDNLTKIYHKCNLCGLLYETTPKRNKLGYKCSYCSGKGIQHYESINFRGNGKYSNLEKQQKHDNLKRNYAKENGYKLLELKYTLDTQDKVENYINNELLI